MPVDNSSVEINECSFVDFSHIKRSSAHTVMFRPTPIFQIFWVGDAYCNYLRTHLGVVLCRFTEPRMLFVKAHHINLIDHHSVRKCEPRVTNCSTALYTNASIWEVDVIDVRLGVDVTQVRVGWNANTTHSATPPDHRRSWFCMINVKYNYERDINSQS